MNKQNLSILRDEGIDITDLDFVAEAIRNYEEDEFFDEGITKSKLELETEELILSLLKDKKISKPFELGLRLRPLGLRLKKLDNELSFRAGLSSVLYEDIDSPIYEYYNSKRKTTKNLRVNYAILKRNGINRKETELDTLRKQKIKLMRKNKR